MRRWPYWAISGSMRDAQLAVDEPCRVIISHHVTALAHLLQQLVPLVRRIPRLLHRKPKQVVADTGYWSQENLQALPQLGVEPFIPPTGANKTIRCRERRAVVRPP